MNKIWIIRIAWIVSLGILAVVPALVSRGTAVTDDAGLQSSGTIAAIVFALGVMGVGTLYTPRRRRTPSYLSQSIYASTKTR